ncbi:S1C family serine protease [Armatimonas sp.]|uniref:S1C family serine protease n=1 Tax=Armatimonas sp. TaxID=1872638 RepID=UPI003751984E
MKEFTKKIMVLGVCSLGLGAGFGAGLGWTGSKAVFAPPVQAQSSAPKSSDEQNVIRVVKSVSPAVVLIKTESGLGTGVVIDGKQGLILTNAHVVGRSAQVGVRLKSGQQLMGRVLRASREIDIAVVKVSSPTPLPAAPLADSDRLEVGQTAIAIGNPLGLEQSVTTGIVSAVNRRLSERQEQGFIQTDAAINPGNSGGPLLDSQGRVIGINTAVLRAEGAEGLGLAIPITVAQDYARKIIAGAQVQRTYLGIQYVGINEQLARTYQLPVSRGVLIAGLDPAGPAAQAGLKPGDILTQLNGTPLNTELDFQRLLRNKKPGETLSFTVKREGSSRTVKARLAEAR